MSGNPRCIGCLTGKTEALDRYINSPAKSKEISYLEFNPFVDTVIAPICHYCQVRISDDLIIFLEMELFEYLWTAKPVWQSGAVTYVAKTLLTNVNKLCMKKEISRFQQFSANDRFELQMIPLNINKESQVTLLLAIRYSVHLVGQQIHGKSNKKSKKESQEGNPLP